MFFGLVQDVAPRPYAIGIAIVLASTPVASFVPGFAPPASTPSRALRIE